MPLMHVQWWWVVQWNHILNKLKGSWIFLAILQRWDCCRNQKWCVMEKYIFYLRWKVLSAPIMKKNIWRKVSVVGLLFWMGWKHCSEENWFQLFHFQWRRLNCFRRWCVINTFCLLWRFLIEWYRKWSYQLN